MEQVARVIGVEGEYALLQVRRASACGESCAHCKGCSGQRQTTRAVNRAGARVGDRVVVELSSGKVLAACFFTYLLPLLLLIGGWIGGGWPVGALLLGVWLVLLWIVDRNSRGKFVGTVIKIIDQADKK